MITIRESTIDDLLANGPALFAEHWDEIALNKSVMVLKPDEGRYRAAEAARQTIVLAAYDDGALVGYSVNFVVNHLHYADLKVCSNDVLFVSKSARQGAIGTRLIRRTIEVARERGAKLMLWHAKPGTALNDLLPHMGCAVQDIIYSQEV